MAIMKFRNNYWTSSKLSKYLYKKVGVNKPRSATFEEWDTWNLETKQKHPVIYWINETLLDVIQDIVYYPYDVWRHFHTWITYSFIKHTSIIDTKLKRGTFHESDELILHGMFSLLVDFVECEKANMYLYCHSEEPRPWWMKNTLTKWKKYRNPELGLKYLDLEISLDGDDNHQSKRAQEIKDLYVWWTTIRRWRVDPFEASGLSEYYDKKEAERKEGDHIFSFIGNKTEEEKAEWKIMSDRQTLMEETNYKLDNKMLIRLINIRRDLWT